jgi:hypothetical protein
VAQIPEAGADQATKDHDWVFTCYAP